MNIKYYSTQRPIGPGTCPMENIVEIKNFDTRKFCPEINRVAWGYIIYSQPLSEREANDYELVSYKNPLTEEKCESLLKILLKQKADEVEEDKGNPYFYFDMPKDQLDLTKFDLERLSESDDPESLLAEMEMDLTFSYARDCLFGDLAEFIRCTLQKKYTPEQVEERMEFIDDFIEEYCIPRYPYFNDEEIQVVIALDTGDGNYDFSTTTREKFWQENSIAWLAKQQGCYEELNNAITNNLSVYDEDGDLIDTLSPFVCTALAEMDEYGGGGMVVFLVTMTIRDFIRLKNLLNSDREKNNSVIYQNRSGERSFIIDKDAVCGLYHPGSGGGSLLGIELEKNVTIPSKAVLDVWIDTGHRQPYGCNGRGYQISYSYDMYPDSFTGTIQFPKED